MFGILILLRILFVASMILIIGYVFGSFSRNPTLTVLTKIASILVIVLFIGTNIFFFRARRAFGPWGPKYQCEWRDRDSTMKHQQQINP